MNPIENESPEPASAFQMRTAFDDVPDWSALVARMGGSESLLRDILALLGREVPKLHQAFAQAVEEKDPKRAQRAAHTFKSNVSHVGLDRIAAFALSLETLARDEQIDSLAQHVTQFAQVSEAVVSWTRELLQQHPSSGTVRK